jgi:hypothetical protein
MVEKVLEVPFSRDICRSRSLWNGREIEEPGKDTKREQKVLEDCLNGERYSIFQLRNLLL